MTTPTLHEVLLHLVDTAQQNPDTDPERLLQFFEEIALEQPGFEALRSTYYSFINLGGSYE